VSGHKFAPHKTTLPTYPVSECERCGAMRIGNRGHWQWRARGAVQWSKKSPACKVEYYASRVESFGPFDYDVMSSFPEAMKYPKP
jgi:hypothetical protein